MIDFQLLRIFVAVARTMSFTRAAEELNSSQSVVSRAVKRLEEQVGTRLIERSTRQVMLTAAGEAYFEEATAALERIAVATGNARRIGLGETAEINLGICASIESPELMRGLAAFRADWPSVDLKFRSILSTGQPDALRAATIDVGILQMGGAGLGGLKWSTLSRQSLAIAVPSLWGLPTDKPVRVADFRDKPFIMPLRAMAPNWYDAVFDVCKRAGFEPRVAGIADDPLTARIMMGCGIGASFLYSRAPGEIGPDVQILELADSDMAPPSETVVAWPEGRSAPQVDRLVQCLVAASQAA